MANTVAVKLLLNGDRNAIVHVYLRSDGASGELTNQTLIDPVVTLGMPAGSRLRLCRVEYNFAGFDAVLQYESGGVDPVWKWVMTEGTNAPINMEQYGNLVDDSSVDGTGKLQITTTGFTASTDQGSMIFKLLK